LRHAFEFADRPLDKTLTRLLQSFAARLVVPPITR
jgi:hypothetical protein